MPSCRLKRRFVRSAPLSAALDSWPDVRDYNNVNQQDQADCNAHGIDYQPCVIPVTCSRATAGTAT
ncbi:hypothetical protein EV644_104349 [Kribbella orskensis]|uniref:Uncharacterized protein n=1 Tax=Kribbella orskensis TaxID=2512216 RepID=A0ABY2BR91_9ACTN|nr:hypothetical protein [Kribbella orskensis]TCN41967.1 hypothetical protein EV642_103349 [Kribbella sp. VKM Ac-2500]TCO25845.1 hypothetical protein EV644_104349 [Kribbella orskensis]